MTGGEKRAARKTGSHPCCFTEIRVLLGIARPTHRAFELLHRLGSERLLVDGLHATVNASVAAIDSTSVSAGDVCQAAPASSRVASATTSWPTAGKCRALS